MNSYLRRSIRSLMLHRLRSLLSTLGILFGVSAVVAMLSIGEGAKRETLEQIGQLGMNTMIIRQNTLSEGQHLQARENLSRGLSEEDAAILQKNVKNILHVAPIKFIKANFPGTLQKMVPEIFAVTRSYADIKELKLASGRFISDLDQNQKNLVCVLGADVAKALGHLGYVGKKIRIENTLFTIVGILQPNQWKASKNAFLATKNTNLAIFIPLGAKNGLHKQIHPENNMLSEILLKVKSSQILSSTAALIKTILKNRHGDYQDYQIIVPRELITQANQTQKTFNLVLGSIAAISLLVGGIGIMNMMLANVSERIREIGIRRALGATRMDILMQFLTETLLLTLFGASMGVMFGIIFSYSIAHFAEWKTIITPWSLILSLCMAGLVGIFSGIYPAYQASRLHPIVALRHE